MGEGPFESDAVANCEGRAAAPHARRTLTDTASRAEHGLFVLPTTRRVEVASTRGVVGFSRLHAAARAPSPEATARTLRRYGSVWMLEAAGRDADISGSQVAAKSAGSISMLARRPQKTAIGRNRRQAQRLRRR